MRPGSTPGTSVSVSEARRLACDAGLLAMVLDGEGRVLDLSRTHRLFDRHQRLVLAHRDRGCVFPRCDRPAAWCEAHHVTSWQDGGGTDVENGVLLSTFTITWCTEVIGRSRSPPTGWPRWCRRRGSSTARR